MLTIIVISMTFTFFVATLYFATQGRVERAQIAGGLAFVSFGACIKIDGSDAWATGLIFLGAVVIALAGRKSSVGRIPTSSFT